MLGCVAPLNRSNAYRSRCRCQWAVALVPQYHAAATSLDTTESTLGYRTIDGGRCPCAVETLQAHPELVALWHRALTLHWHTLSGTYIGEKHWTYPGTPADRPRLLAWHARARLLGVPGRTSKLALDAALTGYYSESAALSRTIVESWAQAAYLRFYPNEALRWYQAPESEPTRDPPSKYSTLSKKLRKAKVDPATITLADQLYAATSKGAHPSAEFFHQAKGEYKGTLQQYFYAPRYAPDYAVDVLEWGVLALLLTLYELGHLVLQPEEWHREYRDIRDGVGREQRARAARTGDELAALDDKGTKRVR